MKKLITVSLLALTIVGSSFAQQGKLNKDTSAFAKSPLYIFKVYGDDKEYNGIPLIDLIGQQQIASMDILKGKMADDKYGVKGKNGVIIITLTKETEIHPITTLLDKYNIGKKYRKLPLYIDSTLTRNTTDMFYTATDKIKNVTVAKEKETGMKYISVLTIEGKVKPAPGVHIRGEARDDM